MARCPSLPRWDREITSIGVNGPTLTIVATNGPANAQYVLMESTNVLRPLPWTPVLTNTFNNSGVLNLSTNVISPGIPDEYLYFAGAVMNIKRMENGHGVHAD